MEIWKDIQGHPDYRISSSGKIWSKRTNRELVINYGIVTLDGKSIQLSTLMGIHFVDGYTQGMTLYRKDSSSPDWSLDNLQAITLEEIVKTDDFKEKMKDGWVKKYGKIYAHKGDKVVEARSTREMADLVGIPKSSITYCLKTGNTHKTGWVFSREEINSN